MSRKVGRIEGLPAGDLDVIAGQDDVVILAQRSDVVLVPVADVDRLIALLTYAKKAKPT